MNCLEAHEQEFEFNGVVPLLTSDDDITLLQYG